MTETTSRFDEHLVDTSVLEGQIAGSRTVPEFTMQAVSNETGVPPDTLRSWERRHGFPTPSRTESNRRLYSHRDIIAVAWLRDQTARGQGTSEAITTVRRILASAENDPAPASPPALVPVSTLTDALLAGDLASAQASWDRAAVTMSVEGLIEHILLPAHGRIATASLPLAGRLRADAFLLRKAVVLLDASSPDQGTRDIVILTHGSANPSLPAYALGAMLSRDGHRIAAAITDLSDATTFAMLQDLGPGTSVVIVTDRPDVGLIDAAASIVGMANIFLWWPHELPDASDAPWLRQSLAGVRVRLHDRA